MQIDVFFLFALQEHQIEKRRLGLRSLLACMLLLVIHEQCTLDYLYICIMYDMMDLLINVCEFDFIFMFIEQ